MTTHRPVTYSTRMLVPLLGHALWTIPDARTFTPARLRAKVARMGAIAIVSFAEDADGSIRVCLANLTTFDAAIALWLDGDEFDTRESLTRALAKA